ncbi:hypothetical protein ACVJF1_004722 [Bradyrhizobium diazoefficiens]
MRASTSLKSLRFAAVLGLMFGALSLGEARAANPLELNFWLSGPRYDGNVADCDKALPTIATQFWEKESAFWNSSLKITGFSAVHETAFRPWQSDNIPAPLLHRRGHAERRQGAQGAFLDHRGWRLRWLRQWCRMVRGRTRPQLGLQSGLSRRQAVIRQP